MKKYYNFRYEALRMTISQELEQRPIMVTYNSEQIVSGSGENQGNVENKEAIETPAPFARGHIHTDQASVFNLYKSVNDPKDYDVETETNDNQTPISGVEHVDLEGNMGLKNSALQSYMLQPKLFQYGNELISYQALDNIDPHLNQNFSDGSTHQEINNSNIMDGCYDKEHNILMATEKNIPEQSIQSAIDSSALNQGENNNFGIMEPSNMAMMIQHRPIAPAHASPVVYAEAANTAILSSSAVHHQLFSEDGSNNVGVRVSNDNDDTQRDFLKEQALAHGFESGV